jgi:hypothetical protein
MYLYVKNAIHDEYLHLFTSLQSKMQNKTANINKHLHTLAHIQTDVYAYVFTCTRMCINNIHRITLSSPKSSILCDKGIYCGAFVLLMSPVTDGRSQLLQYFHLIDLQFNVRRAASM